jgi:DNA segregation ATPase FtsK/SpoIIIE, S-DNA-T family
LNPFDDIILLAPRRREAGLDCGINAEVLSALLSDFSALEALRAEVSAGEVPQLPGARLVLSPQHGYGKSHLLGRLFRALAERAVCIYLTPYADPSGGWRAVLNAAVDELCQLQNFSTVTGGEQPVPQMEFLAYNVLLSLVEQRRHAGRLSEEEVDAHLSLNQTLSRDPGAWLRWLSRSGVLDQLGAELRRAGLDLAPSSRAWVQALFRYAEASEGDELRHDAIDWLRAKPLDEEQVARLGLRPQDCPAVEAARPVLNALARERLSMLCRLARFHMPLLLCFDQIESFCHEPALTRSFGNLVCELVNAQDAVGPSFPNVMTVVTANQLEWEGVVKPALYPAELQRFRPHQALYLEPPSRAQATALATLRLQRAGYGAATQALFIHGPWMDACFQGERASFGVRDFLLRCQQQWEAFEVAQASDSASTSHASLSDLEALSDVPLSALLSPSEAEVAADVDVEIAPAPPRASSTASTAPGQEGHHPVIARLGEVEQDLKRQDGALRFHADTLTWWVSQFGRSLPGVDVALLDDKSNYVSVAWRRDGVVVGFVVDDNPHWRRWRAIREEVQRLQTSTQGALKKVVALRTLDLARLPGAAWAQEGEPFRQALRTNLDLIVVDRAWVARIYAARVVITEVEQGKLASDAGAAGAIALLSPLLEPLCERLLASLPVTSKALPDVPPLSAARALRPPAPNDDAPSLAPRPQAAGASSTNDKPDSADSFDSPASQGTHTRLSVSDLLRVKGGAPSPALHSSGSLGASAAHGGQGGEGVVSAGAGSIFHGCARALTLALINDAEAPSPGAKQPPLWSFFRSRVLAPSPQQQPWQRVQDPTRAADLQVALRALCGHLEALGRDLPRGARWSDLLLDAEAERSDTWAFPGGYAEISGRIDAIRRAPDGALEVIDYKLRDRPHDEDILQVAAYAWLLGAPDASPPIRGRVEYFTPALVVREVSSDEVRRLITRVLTPRLQAALAAAAAHVPAATAATTAVVADQAAMMAPHAAPFDAAALVRVLADYGLDVEVRDPPIEAPQVQRLRLHPQGKTTFKQIEQRGSDLKVKLSLREVPLITPGQGAVYLDIPRAQTLPVHWEPFFSSWRQRAVSPSPLTIPLALSVDGDPLCLDLLDPGQAHVLVAGTSGSGKSELLRAMLASLCALNAPSHLQLTLIDPKRVTFSSLQGSPYLRDASGEVFFDLQQSIERLEALSAQMDLAYKALSSSSPPPTTAHVILIDEFADLATHRALSKRFEAVVQRLAALGRAANLHLVLATQYPDHQTISSAIKVNLPIRVCLKMPAGKNSMVVLDQPGAEALLGRGDLLCMGISSSLQRGQSPLVSAQTISALLNPSPSAHR